MISKALYCFISHQNFILSDINSIGNMMKLMNCDDYIIVYGGANLNISDKNTIHLDCHDDYCSLPAKINSLNKYVIQNKQNYEYYFKIDRTVQIKSLIETQLNDYCGFVRRFTNTTFHFNRCDKTSRWYNKPFIIEDIQYCSGITYCLSKASAHHIANDNTEYYDHVYEDVYVGYILKKNNIYPKYLNLKTYIYDPTHPKLTT